MAEREFPSNSNTSKLKEMQRPERPHATSIASRTNNKVPDTAMKRFIKLFLAEDVDDVGEYLVKDLIIPGVKDVFFNFLWALFWGDRRAGGSIGLNGRTNYNKVSQTAKIRTLGGGNKTPKEDPEEIQALKKLDLNNIQFASQAEAKEVLMAMKMYLDEYPSVPAGYLQELLGETKDWTSEYYGWTDLGDARIRPTSRGGWLLVLPRPERL